MIDYQKHELNCETKSEARVYSKLEELAVAIRERRVILFAGAGVSMSVGLPSWHELIGHLRSQLDLPADTDDRSSYQMLAEFYRLKQGSIGPLRSWMDRAWHVSREQVEKSEIHRLLVELDFPVIYTTNYDSNLEIAHELHGREYMKVTSVRDIARAREGTRQIVKFHGDFDDDSSLVITETDYLDRLAFDSPLDIKFRSDSLGKTLLFIGYSVSDPNIRLLLHRLWRMWRDSGSEKDRPQSYLFAAKEDPVRDAVLAQWGIVALAEPAEHPAIGLQRFLEKLTAIVHGLPEPSP
jgi:hypothetical protein